MIILAIDRLVRQLTRVSLSPSTILRSAERTSVQSLAHHTGLRERTSAVTIERHFSSSTRTLRNIPWTPDEDKKLCESRLAGVSNETISKDLGRTLSAIKNRLMFLRKQRPELCPLLHDAGRQFSAHEDQLLVDMTSAGSSWAQIKDALPKRSLAVVKARFRTIRDPESRGRNITYSADSRTRGKPWSAEDDNELYHSLFVLDLSVVDVSARLSRSVAAVDWRKNLLGLQKRKRNNPFWTPEEDAKVLSRGVQTPWREIIAQLPGRSTAQAACRWHYLRTRPEALTGTNARSWTPEEDAAVRRMLAAGDSIEAMSGVLPMRTVGACFRRVTTFRAQARLKKKKHLEDQS